MSRANNTAQSWDDCTDKSWLKEDVNDVRVPCSSPVLITALHIDVDMMSESVDRAVMAEQRNSQLKLTPRDLYVKSHPGLLTDMDFTNPRNWYSSHAHVQVFGDTTKLPTANSAPPLVLPSLHKIRTLTNDTATRDMNNRVDNGEIAHQSNSQISANNGRVSENSSSQTNNIFNQGDLFLTQLPLVSTKDSPDITIHKSESCALPGIAASKNDQQNGDKAPKNSSINYKYLCLDSYLQDVPSEQKNIIKREMLYANIQKRLAESFHHSREKLAQFPETRPHVTVAEKYQELILPKPDIEREKFENLRRNYTLTQKSILKLKLSPKKHKKNKCKLGNSSKKNRLQPPTSGTTESPGGLNSPQDPSADLLLVSSANRGSSVERSQNAINEATGHIAEGETYIANGEKTPTKINENRRYVYKAPDDGFLQRASQADASKAAVINLSIAKKAPKRLHGLNQEDSELTKYQDKVTESKTDGADTPMHQIRNKTPHEAQSARSGRLSKKSQYSESNKSFGSAKSTLRKFKRLEVFSEKRKQEASQGIVEDNENNTV